MDGLYAVLDYAARQVRLCPFLYSLSLGRREVRRLRQIDPPSDVIVPIELLPMIAPEDQLVARHLLMRAVIGVMQEEKERAARYLTAFSALARVRFAYVKAIEEPAGLAVELEAITAVNYRKVHRLFSQPFADQ